MALRYMPQSLAFPEAPSQEQDIPDPFYDNDSGLSEAQRLHAVIRQMQTACRGLLQHLVDLQHRCPHTLAHSDRCFSISASANSCRCCCGFILMQRHTLSSKPCL